MIQNNVEQTIDNSVYSHYVGVKFYNTPRAYFFGLKKDDEPVQLGDKVVVETVRGLELGEIAIEPISIDKYDSELGLKPILRKATTIDVKIHESNINQGEELLASLGRTNDTEDGVAGLQAHQLDLRLRHIDVVGRGQVVIVGRT